MRRSFFCLVESLASAAEARRAFSSFERVEPATAITADISSPIPFGRKVSSDFPRHCLRNRLWRAAVHNSDIDSRLASHLCRPQLAAHASAPQLAVPIAQCLDGRSQIANRTDQARSLAVRSVEAVDIGEQDKPLCTHGGRQQGAQFVIVAEGSYQLAYRDTVVFIDDG